MMLCVTSFDFAMLSFSNSAIISWLRCMRSWSFFIIFSYSACARSCVANTLFCTFVSNAAASSCRFFLSFSMMLLMLISLRIISFCISCANSNFSNSES